MTHMGPGYHYTLNLTHTNKHILRAIVNKHFLVIKLHFDHYNWAI